MRVSRREIVRTIFVTASCDNCEDEMRMIGDNGHAFIYYCQKCDIEEECEEEYPHQEFMFGDELKDTPSDLN